MKHSCLRRLFALLLVFLICASASAQRYTLGPQGLVSARARTIEYDISVDDGLGSYAWLTQVGGVAFDQVASPMGELRFASLTLAYRPERADGHRLALTLDGQAVAAPLYDWQLIPIARFADSPYYACLTLFGQLEDSARQRRVRESGGYIINYHPVFVDTLIGLRLLQLDSLIINPYSYDLIKDGENYPLGAGESRPNLRANQRGQRAFQSFFSPIGFSASSGRRQQIFTSYVISDYGRNVTFDVARGSLHLSGHPTYYFWAAQPSASGNARARPLPNLSAQVSNRPDLLRGINPTVWDASVTLMRYAAFFRYFKQNNSEMWRNFMAQINSAPTPLPRVITPTIMEPLR